mmetsp:Transcript_1893/g.3428  ORF Transcript_1893/g.3428 Transcript_1893/m.3428 type:complete len:476 (-) Transcript_1893:828-2255(-)
MGVETRAQYDEIGAEAPDGVVNNTRQRLPDQLGRDLLPHGDVQNAPVGRLVPALSGEDVVRPPGLAPLHPVLVLFVALAVPVPAPVLGPGVHAHVQEPGVVGLAQNVLRPVAVVNVKVDYTDALQPQSSVLQLRHRVLRRRRGAVQQAEPVARGLHRLQAGSCVVPRGTSCAEGVHGLPGDDHLHGLQRAGDAADGRVVASGAAARVVPALSIRVVRQRHSPLQPADGLDPLAQARQILLLVDHGQDGLSGELRELALDASVDLEPALDRLVARVSGPLQSSGQPDASLKAPRSGQVPIAIRVGQHATDSAPGLLPRQHPPCEPEQPLAGVPPLGQIVLALFPVRQAHEGPQNSVLASDLQHENGLQNPGRVAVPLVRVHVLPLLLFAVVILDLFRDHVQNAQERFPQTAQVNGLRLLRGLLRSLGKLAEGGVALLDHGDEEIQADELVDFEVLVVDGGHLTGGEGITSDGAVAC